MTALELPLSAPNAGCGRRTSRQAALANELTAGRALAVAAVGDPAERRVDLSELLARLAQQGRDVLTLEGQGGALRVMLVVGAARG